MRDIWKSDIRRTVALPLALALALALAACGDEGEEDTPAADDDTTEEVEEEEPEPEDEESAAAGEAGGLVCVIVPAVENPFFGAMQEIAADKVEELGYESRRLVHDDDASRQLELFDSCIGDGAVGIILDNAGAEATVAAVQRAADAGVGSFLVDREITEDGIAQAQIVSNNFQGATIVAEYFAELMEGEGGYIELTGRDTDTNAHVRSDGFESVLETFPDMTKLAEQTANWSQTEGFDVMETLLAEYPDVKGVIAGNDTMALGAQAALLAAGRDDVVVVGFDGSDDAIESIMRGELKATSLQPVAEMATQAAIQMDQWVRTGDTGMEEKQSIDMVLITADNACMYERFALVADPPDSC